jgi:hypothetical protein
MKTLSSILAASLLAGPSFIQAENYIVEDIAPPENTLLEVTGFAWLDHDALAVALRRGEIWILEDGKWSRFATGLQELHGIVADSRYQMYATQRTELTRLVDEDKDGAADLYQRFGSGWDYHGSYHEFVIGLVRDDAGDFFFNLGLAFYTRSPFGSKWLGTNQAHDKGWHVKVTKDGTYQKLAPGLRAPNGIGLSPEGDIFTTDNQGSFMAVGMLFHVTKGDFLGHPDGLLWDPSRSAELEKLQAISQHNERDTMLNDMRKRPVVYLAYPDLGKSCGHPVWDTTGGKFGPYTGQIFIPDVVSPIIVRVSTQKVNGEYQGASYPFIKNGPLEGAGAGNRMIFDKKGTLYVGSTARGWGRGEGLKTITWNGTVNMEIQEMMLTNTGFDLVFTKPVDPAIAANKDTYQLQQLQYQYTHMYGGKKINSSPLTVSEISISKDGKKVSLTIDDLKADHVIELRCPDMHAADGEKIEYGYADYTLNQLIEE